MPKYRLEFVASVCNDDPSELLDRFQEWVVELVRDDPSFWEEDEEDEEFWEQIRAECSVRLL